VLRLAYAAALCLLLLLAGGSITASAARPLALGFAEDALLSPNSSSRATRFDEIAALGGGIARVSVRWSEVAPAVRPASFRAADPGSPGYSFGALDATIRDAAARRIRVLLTIVSAPRWAEGAGRPGGAPRGAWRPSPAALRDFATATARRYSGGYPDPARQGAVLPRVRYWQVWNEPNLSLYLSPQWERRGGRLDLESPRIYRGMLNAAYAGVKSAGRDNVVVGAGTAPYGEPFPGGSKVMPVRFLRSLLCLEGRRLRAVRCPRPARLDAISHHPYAVRGPRNRALNADDATIPDVHKLVRVVRAAVRKRRVLPRRRKRIWVTEVSWDSRPPDPRGVPAATHARWLQESFFLLWRQGVDTIMWFQVRDQPPRPSYAETFQSGVLRAGGGRKPAARAFRFPFVVNRGRRGRPVAWGRAPSGGTVTIERRRGGAWRAQRSFGVRRSATFLLALRPARDGVYRARLGRDTSLTWRLR